MSVKPYEFIHELFDARLAQTPFQPFIFTRDATLTLSDLDALVVALVQELKADGVQPGDRILTVAEN